MADLDIQYICTHKAIRSLDQQPVRISFLWYTKHTFFYSKQDEMTDKTRFSLLEGGRDKQTIVNTVSIVVGPDSLSSQSVDVRVFEEDTHLVLTVDPVMRYMEEHPIRLMTSVLEAKPGKPGSIVTNRASWYAVIHDLDADPTCRREWIAKAYQAALTLAEKKMIPRLGLPLLGSVHGKILAAESLEMLINAMRIISFQHLKIIRKGIIYCLGAQV